MRFFKNKHVITTMIVATVLAIARYYSVDRVVKEVSLKAVADNAFIVVGNAFKVFGNAFKLIAKSNCRFSRGKCDFENGNFKSSNKVNNDVGKQALALISDNVLHNASVGFITAVGVELESITLMASNNPGQRWSAA